MLPQLKKTYKELLERDRCQPWRTQVPLFAQLPLWITMSLGMLQLSLPLFHQFNSLHHPIVLQNPSPPPIP